MTSYRRIFSNGLLRENPTLRLVLGTCPTLAVTTMAFNGLGMGLAATFVLVCSNMAISALRHVIPRQVRIPCYITLIAGFVTVVQMLMRAFLYDLYTALGVFLPLIVVNCIILGRAEMFASKNGVLASALDGLGMGLGFTLTLTLMGTVREVLGSGTWMAGLTDRPLLDITGVLPPMGIFARAPGGFFVFGCFMAAAGALQRRLDAAPARRAAKNGRPPAPQGAPAGCAPAECAGCAGAALCGAATGGGLPPEKDGSAQADAAPDDTDEQAPAAPEDTPALSGAPQGR